MYNDSLVVTDVSCDMYGNCVNTSSNTTDCEEFATVTCGISKSMVQSQPGLPFVYCYCL